MSEVPCPACETGRMSVFLEIPRAPVLCTLLCATPEEARRAPVAPIRWAFCNECALIYNVAFDPRLLEYTGAYENSLHFSPRYQQYAGQCARELVERYGLHGKRIIDIGCGQGDFLSLICTLGGGRGVGFDPSFDPTKPATALPANVTIKPELFGPSHGREPADLICCRHVLEHIPRPLEFLRDLRRTIGSRRDTILFFEVPNAMHTLHHGAAWEIIYEHCSYFTRTALCRLFETAGFEAIRTAETFEAEFLTIEARPRSEAAVIEKALRPDAETLGLIERFRDDYAAKVELWRRRMADIRAQGLRAVLWGAGARAISFTNTLNIGDDRVPYAVDLNPRKHNHYLTGTAQKIVPPAFLREYRPDLIIIVNPIYYEEIAEMAGNLGVQAELIVAE